MSAKVQDAVAGERWRRKPHALTGSYEGQAVCLGGELFMACRNQDAAYILRMSDLDEHWHKTHNADGSPYEPPKPLPEFGECWAARDKDGEVYLYADDPERCRIEWEGRNKQWIGKIAFRPSLPWDQTACRVRVRLEVVEYGK